MAKQFPRLDQRLTDFIQAQQIFFVATAPAAGRVNCSPKGMDSLRVLAPDRICWLNVTGSGNETAAHVLENGRMTLMWCAFAGPPLILRAYGTARTVHRLDADWEDLSAQLPQQPGARQIFDLKIELVQTSCGMAVPYFDFQEDRRLLSDWANKKEADGTLAAYWEEKNLVSVDGQPTGLPLPE
ncbi:pyridoxamine 5'-phosphate oxidase family protein [Neolewinella lacunae]|uniref:Pyridoxamine 5'-phosphate oxidase family protein n=1 Tax=Neolewinella lacunae TaxID=1517758 RepID=A0A923T8W0_9BACT|nr:pyridoxamine 5'-phosphate oxidase family protein [Neolewinella lacunae]MBC6994393.1 pyridoxamine 5'-phosphate oxidase family protein [Neolewinella lacunae]MDN3633324.1 pyridoxamine 5'-phosphate oxidase family protein [Neolewinella lacunae]